MSSELENSNGVNGFRVSFKKFIVFSFLKYQIFRYVFCFPCIVRHLREHPRCPVTNLPAKSLDIVRLYDAE